MIEYYSFKGVIWIKYLVMVYAMLYHDPAIDWDMVHYLEIQP